MKPSSFAYLGIAVVIFWLCAAGGYRSYKYVREVNEPNPATYPPASVSDRLFKYSGKECEVSKVLYVNRDDDIYIFEGRFKNPSDNIDDEDFGVLIKVKKLTQGYKIGFVRLEGSGDDVQRKINFPLRWNEVK